MTAAQVSTQHATVVHALIEAAQFAPQREALVVGNERYSYGDFLASTILLAQQLQALSVVNARVAVLMHNGADVCVAMFAVHMARAQLVPLNASYTTHELRPLLAQADVKVMIYDDSLHQTVEALRAADGFSTMPIDPATNKLCQAQATIPPLPELLPEPGDPAMLQFTGGTTGIPKGASISHRALMTNVLQREALVPSHRDEERMLCVMPLFHCYAIHVCLHNMVNSRGTLVIVYPYHPTSVLQTLAQERITVFGGSPTLFAGLLAHEAFRATDFTTLRTTYSGSASLPADLLRRWEELTTSRVVEGYGQSEAGPVISFNPLHGVRKPGSVGLALPDTSIEIVDVETGQQRIPPHQSGEIRVRGPQIMTEYFGQAQATALTVRDGWLYTGDIGEFDDDGYLYIRGRKKDMLIVSGYNVYPAEIEAVLYTHDAVIEAAVVGVPDEYRGELPVAFVVTHDADLGSADLQSYCAARLSKHKVPTAFYLTESLVKTAVGKVDKVRLTQCAEKATANSMRGNS